MVVSIDPKLPILIAGAGPAGLALAQGLRKRGIPYRVFERDNESHGRSQGWGVALQWTVKPLQANIPDDLPPVDTISHLHNLGLKTDVEAFDRHGNKVAPRTNSGDFLRADRSRLRDWLATNIDVEWDKKVSRYEETTEDVKLYFEDGSFAEGCALIGAEGGKSPVRSQLVPHAELRDSHIEAVMGYLVMSRQDYEDVFSEMARSVNVIQGDDIFMFQGLHNMPDNAESANMYWMLFRPESKPDANSFRESLSKSQLQKEALEWSEPLPETFRRFVKQTSTKDFGAMTNFLQVWGPPDSGVSTDKVTLIGDAMHKILPLGGVGVNHAIQDTLDLCELFDSKDTVAAVLKEYDAGVTKRGQEAVEKCLQWPVLPVNGQ